MLATHAATEVRLTLRHGEHVLLTLLIPVVLLIGMTTVSIIPLDEPRVATVTPQVLALAIMSTAFTSQAIALGFDRRYGVLRRLAATALPRWLLVGGRVLATLVVVSVQLAVLGTVAALLGWAPAWSGIAPGLVTVLLGTLAFGGLGVLLGGAVRAEVVLAVANAVWFLLVLAGGIAVPSTHLPEWPARVAEFLPSGALADGLRSCLVTGGGPGWQPVVVLLVWAGVTLTVAARTTRLD
jgi:ABC-2 type transport system permease protein